MIRSECFGMIERALKYECTVTDRTDCEGCPFYKTREQLHEERRESVKSLTQRGLQYLLDQYNITRWVELENDG